MDTVTRACLLVLLIPAASLAAQPAAPIPLNAKVTETPMGPVNAGSLVARLYLSEDGNHIGVVGVKGSRQIVLLDGVEGPVFDEIPSNQLGNGNLGVFWSPTGGHSVYIGRRGADFIAVVDGKEAGTVISQQTMVGYGSLGPGGMWKAWFSKDGAKVAYAVVPEAGAWVMIENGVKSPMYKTIDFTSVQLKGTRLVYAAQSLDSQWHVVADGKMGPGYTGVSGLLLTPDGLHYAYVASKTAAGVFSQMAVTDGVEGKAYQSVGDLELAPDGRVAYSVAFKQSDITRTSGPGGLWIGGAVYQGAQTFNIAKAGGYSQSGFNIVHVAWSADGKRAAWVQRDAPAPGTQPKPGVQVMVNGKPMGLTYTSVNELQWSPDGSHIAYTATAPNGGWFANIDGQESDAFNLIYGISFGASGAHSMILGTTPNGPTAVLDGKPLGKFIGLNTVDIAAWSPDGSHVAWPVQSSVNGFTAMKDGTPLPGRLGNFMALNYVQPQITFPPLVWSPDGLHLAYAGVRPSDGHSVVFVDNTMYEGPGQSHTYPSFSTDGKRFATIMTTGKGWLAFIDGKSSQPYEDIVKNTRNAARFTGPNTYRFYGVKGGMIYRVTLDL